MEDIDKYIEYYTINKVQRNTLKEYLCCIRVYLRYAVEKGWCITDLDKALITPKVYSEENLPSFLPWNKVQNCYKQSKNKLVNPHRATMLFYVTCYVRFTL